VLIFVLGHHLGFGNCGGLGQGNICWGEGGVGVNWKKLVRREGEGKHCRLPSTVSVQNITMTETIQTINTHLSLSRASQPFGEVPSFLVYSCFTSRLKAKNLSYVSKTVSI